MVGTAVLVIQIVGVFPHIEGQQRTKPLLHRVGRVGLLCDHQLAVSVGGEPHPTGAEQRGTRLHERLLELLERAELRVDGFRKRTRGLVVGQRTAELLEIEVVVQNLAGVVKHPAGGRLHDLHQILVRERCAFDGRIQIVDISLQVFAVVKADGLFRNHRFQGVCRIRQRNQFKFSHIAKFFG